MRFKSLLPLVVMPSALRMVPVIALPAILGAMPIGVVPSASVTPVDGRAHVHEAVAPQSVPQSRRLPTGLTDSTPSLRLVASGVIEGSGTNAVVLLPVTIHGHAGAVILDVGSQGGLALTNDVAAIALGIDTDAVALDALTFGTATEHDVRMLDLAMLGPIRGASRAPGMPPVVGILGTAVLSKYELLIDGPKRQVQLYQPSVAPTGPDAPKQTSFPAGLTAADCVPMPPIPDPADGLVGLPLAVNGRSVTSIFDSGSGTTTMNLLAARLLGLTQHAPNVRRIPDGQGGCYPVGGGCVKYEATGVVLTLGARTLTVPVGIANHIPFNAPEETPLVFLGLDAFRDRALWISFHTRQVCLSTPR